MNPVISSLLLAAALLLSGCASFEKKWQHAQQPTRSASTDTLAGAWEGSWTSATTGHTGKLRCVIEPADGDKYHCIYHAHWGKFFSKTFTLTCQVKRGKSETRITGGTDLGPLLGGYFDHDAKVRDDDFQATYKSSADNGTFQMKKWRGHSAHKAHHSDSNR